MASLVVLNLCSVYRLVISPKRARIVEFFKVKKVRRSSIFLLSGCKMLFDLSRGEWSPTKLCANLVLVDIVLSEVNSQCQHHSFNIGQCLNEIHVNWQEPKFSFRYSG